MRPLIFCPHCRLLFLSNAMDLSAALISISDVREDCQRCGQTAQAIDGVYRFIEEANEFAFSAAASPDILHAIGVLAQKAAFGEIDPASAEHQARKISPEAAGLFVRIRANLKDAILVAAALATIGGLFLAYSANKSAEEAQARTEKLLKRLIETQEHDDRHHQKRTPNPSFGPIPAYKHQPSNQPPQNNPNRRARRRAKALARKSR